MYCHWKIIAPHGRQLRIELLDLDIEKGNNCQYDYLQIIDDVQSGTVLKLCGTKGPKDIISSTNGTIKMEFHSDISASGKGFQIRYRLDKGI